MGIVVLNYHHPEETLDCVRSLLAKEPPSTRILWLENDAAASGAKAEMILAASGLPWVPLDRPRDPLPPAGVIGYITNSENLGYAGGNNVGLHYLLAKGVPFAWVLNNDTLLQKGSSLDLVASPNPGPRWGFGRTALRQNEPSTTGAS